MNLLFISNHIAPIDFCSKRNSSIRDISNRSWENDLDYQSDTDINFEHINWNYYSLNSIGTLMSRTTNITLSYTTFQDYCQKSFENIIDEVEVYGYPFEFEMHRWYRINNELEPIEEEY